MNKRTSPYLSSRCLGSTVALSLRAMKVCSLTFLGPTLMNHGLVTKEEKEKMKDSMMEKSVN